MCKHENFRAQVNVNRLEDSGNFSADITINCDQCGLPFQFLGLQPGLNLAGAACSLDGTEARIAICPQGARQNPMQMLGFGIRSVS